MVTRIPVLELRNTIKEKTFQFETHSKLRVQEMYFENQISMVVKQTFVNWHEETIDEDGHTTNEGYTIRVDILDFKQTATDEFNQFIADINAVTDTVIVRTDSYGAIEEVLNIDEILRRWKRIKPTLLEKHKAKPNAAAFFDAFEKQFTKVEEIEFALANKGLYGILFPGIYDRDLGKSYEYFKTIHGYFNQIDLPLRVTYSSHIQEKTSAVVSNDKWSTFPEERTEKYLEISSDNTVINEVEFKRTAFGAMLKTMVDSLRANTDITLINQEKYYVDVESGWLITASQKLRTEVPGAYMNEQSHTLAQLDN